MAGLTGCSTAQPSATVSATASAPPAAASVTIPDATGKDGASAREILQDLGLAVEFKSDNGKSVIAASNWTVVSTVPAAGVTLPAGQSVTVNVTKPAATPTVVEQEATSAGLTGTYAQAACDTYGKSQFPYGFKAAWIAGKLADRVENDQWFFKVTAKVKNEYGAQRETTIECTIAGSNESPERCHVPRLLDEPRVERH
jgi:Uncharacterized protein conserved in bacteria